MKFRFELRFGSLSQFRFRFQSRFRLRLRFQLRFQIWSQCRFRFRLRFQYQFQSRFQFRWSGKPSPRNCSRPGCCSRYCCSNTGLCIAQWRNCIGRRRTSSGNLSGIGRCRRRLRQEFSQAIGRTRVPSSWRYYRPFQGQLVDMFLRRCTCRYCRREGWQRRSCYREGYHLPRCCCTFPPWTRPRSSDRHRRTRCCSKRPPCRRC